MSSAAAVAGAPRFLELEGFGAGFGANVVLEEIGLWMPPRGVLAVVGPSASGKTVLLRTVAGLCHGQASYRHWGRAVLAGRTIGPSHGVGLVRQSSEALNRSVAENLGVSDPGRAAAVDALSGELGLVGLGELLDRPLLGLPLVLQREVGVLRLLVEGVPAVALDEPLNSLSPGEAEEMLAFLHRVGRRVPVLVAGRSRALGAAVGGGVLQLFAGRVEAFTPVPEPDPPELDVPIEGPVSLPPAELGAVSSVFAPAPEAPAEPAGGAVEPEVEAPRPALGRIDSNPWPVLSPEPVSVPMGALRWGLLVGGVALALGAALAWIGG